MINRTLSTLCGLTFLWLIHHSVDQKSFAQEKNDAPYYASLPELKPLFDDDFQKDTRAEYLMIGNKDHVQFREGSLGIGDGSGIARQLDKGPRIEGEINLEFP